MNANANKAPFKRSSPSRSPSPLLCISPYKELITRSSPRRRRGGKDELEERQPAAGRSLHSLFSVEIWKRGETLMMSRGFHRGKWRDSKGKWEHYSFLYIPPSPVPCCFNKARQGTRETARGGGDRESRLEVSHKAQAGAFCSNYRQIGDLDISARWSISW